MTAKELHEQKIIPMRQALRKLEEEYKELYRKECGEKVGAVAGCYNCAYSCVLKIGDHNGCMGGKCTCCNGWCYKWIPENEVSAFLRKNYEYESEVYYRLESLFGDDFLKNGNMELLMEGLHLLAKMDGKGEGE